MTALLAKADPAGSRSQAGSGKNAKPTVRARDGRCRSRSSSTRPSLKIEPHQQHRPAAARPPRPSGARTRRSQPATLAFDLEFDTAEERAAGAASRVDVRTTDPDRPAVRRAAARRSPTQPPPPVRFIWGTFIFHGIVTQLTEDLDYFSADGTPAAGQGHPDDHRAEPRVRGQAGRRRRRATSARRPPGGRRGRAPGPAAQPAPNPDTAGAGPGRRERAAAADPARRRPGGLALGDGRARQPARAGRRRPGPAGRGGHRGRRARGLGGFAPGVERPASAIAGRGAGRPGGASASLAAAEACRRGVRRRRCSAGAGASAGAGSRRSAPAGSAGGGVAAGRRGGGRVRAGRRWRRRGVAAPRCAAADAGPPWPRPGPRSTSPAAGRRAARLRRRGRCRSVGRRRRRG